MWRQVAARLYRTSPPVPPPGEESERNPKHGKGVLRSKASSGETHGWSLTRVFPGMKAVWFGSRNGPDLAWFSRKVWFSVPRWTYHARRRCSGRCGPGPSGLRTLGSTSGARSLIPMQERVSHAQPEACRTEHHLGPSM